LKFFEASSSFLDFLDYFGFLIHSFWTSTDFLRKYYLILLFLIKEKKKAKKSNFLPGLNDLFSANFNSKFLSTSRFFSFSFFSDNLGFINSNVFLMETSSDFFLFLLSL